MVRLNRIWTGKGDQGQTSLGDGSLCRKDDLRIECIGSIDEVNAALGLCRTETQYQPDIENILALIQHDLFDLGADLCLPERESKENAAISEESEKPPPAEPLRMVRAQTLRLQDTITRYNANLESLRSFVLPGGSRLAARLHAARTIARRAERACVKLHGVQPLNPEILAYLNRLSDLLFVLARIANDCGQTDTLWQAGQNRDREEDQESTPPPTSDDKQNPPSQ